MKRTMLACALLLATFALTAEDEWFWGKPISGIQWQGVNHADRRGLDSLASTYIGKPFTQELWAELQGRVYELDWFDTIDPEAFPGDASKTSVIVKLIVKEKPAIGHVKVQGNSGLHATEILDAVKTKTGDIYAPQSAKLDELAVKRLYLEKGFTEATVTSTVTEPTEAGEVDLVFVVAEGSKLAVRSIKFSGSAAFGDKTLKAAMVLKEAGLFQDGSFQESKLEEDRQKIVELYRSKGYVDAAVSDVVRTYTKDPKGGKGLLDLTFVISEGKPWVLGGIGFEGNRIFSSEKLMVFMQQKPGGAVNLQRLLADKQRVEDLYYESGYIFNSIDLVDKRDEEKLVVNYTIRIAERDRAHIESIAFAGNTKSKESVLFRELPLKVGDVFSKAKIVEGLRNLYNLQYFSSVVPDMKPGSAEGLMDLVINLEEQSTADINFGVTLSGLGDPNAFPVSGLIKWSDRNFLGNGQTFSIELNAAPDDQSLTFSFLDNWLLDRRLSGGIDLALSHKTTTTPVDTAAPVFGDGVPDPYNSYEEYKAANFIVPAAYQMPYDKTALTLGLNTGYGWTMPGGNYGLGLGMASGLTNVAYDSEKYRPATASIRTEQGRWVLGNKVSGKVYINNLDYWVNPTKGIYASQKLSYAGFLDFEPEHYIRSDTRLDAFMTLFSFPVLDSWKLKMVAGAHSGFQALLAQPGHSEVLVSTENAVHIDGTFYGRGWHSLYSYDGLQLWENWIELRMPLVESIVWLDGFLDAAVLNTRQGLLLPSGQSTVNSSIDSANKDFTGLSFRNFALSAGFGFRFTVAQFPFRFYFAKRAVFDGSTISFPNSALDFVISISQPLN
ncbi:MAG: outer membrane protein assembly factor BamA [Rectinemataceae bacterium]